MALKPKTQSLVQDLLQARSNRPAAESFLQIFSPLHSNRLFIDNYATSYLQEAL
jgi:hypothetical protein